jgi:hypothetical protein
VYCDEKIDLLNAFRLAADTYANAAKDLWQSAKMRTVEYPALKLSAEKARLRCHEMRANYAGHTAKHGCNGTGAATA